jgi:hypothetical protein
MLSAGMLRKRSLLPSGMVAGYWLAIDNRHWPIVRIDGGPVSGDPDAAAPS